MKAFKIALLTLVILGVGFLIGWFVGEGVYKKKLEEEIRKVDVRNSIRMENIGRLQEESNKLDSAIKEKKEILERVDTLWLVEKERIWTLPLDSSVLLLQQNLEIYEWRYCK